MEKEQLTLVMMGKTPQINGVSSHRKQEEEMPSVMHMSANCTSGDYTASSTIFTNLYKNAEFLLLFMSYVVSTHNT